MNSESIYKRDRWTSHGMSHCPMGLWEAMDNPTVPWDHGIGWTVGHICICRVTGGHSMECPTVPMDCGMRLSITAFPDIYAENTKEKAKME